MKILDGEHMKTDVVIVGQAGLFDDILQVSYVLVNVFLIYIISF